MHHTPLHRYIQMDEAFYAVYEGYLPDVETIERIRSVRPQAHVITPCRYSCRDCLHNLPRMARIAEHLPGWTWEVFDSTANPQRLTALGITRTPTFIVYAHQGGPELGRIVENPGSGSLEIDLLRIVER